MYDVLAKTVKMCTNKAKYNEIDTTGAPALAPLIVFIDRLSKNGLSVPVKL